MNISLCTKDYDHSCFVCYVKKKKNLIPIHDCSDGREKMSRRGVNIKARRAILSWCFCTVKSFWLAPWIYEKTLRVSAKLQCLRWVWQTSCTRLEDFVIYWLLTGLEITAEFLKNTLYPLSDINKLRMSKEGKNGQRFRTKNRRFVVVECVGLMEYVWLYTLDEVSGLVAVLSQNVTERLSSCVM